MKKFLALLIVVVGLAGYKGCKEKDTGNFTVNLQGFVGSSPLSFVNSIYTDSISKEFYFSKLKFFLAHVKLVRMDNTEVEIADAVYFDYSDNNRNSFSADVDAGTYKGIKFNVGLDAQQNSTNPDDYGSDEALGPHDDMYWSWLKHRFIVLEGVADTAGNNFNGGVVSLGYHVGTDTCYKSVSLLGSDFTVNAGEKKSVALNLDLLKIFKNASNPIDMFKTPGTQSESADLHVALKFTDRFCESFSYSE